MPASMISAPAGGSRKVTGNNNAMVATGPTPGSTPISGADNRADQAEQQVLRGQRDAESERQVVQDVHVSRPRELELAV